MARVGCQAVVATALGPCSASTHSCKDIACSDQRSHCSRCSSLGGAQLVAHFAMNTIHSCVEKARMLAPAAAEMLCASCLIGLLLSVRGCLLQAHALARAQLHVHCSWEETCPTRGWALGAALLPAPDPGPAATSSAAAIACWPSISKVSSTSQDSESSPTCSSGQELLHKIWTMWWPQTRAAVGCNNGAPACISLSSMSFFAFLQ